MRDEAAHRHARTEVEQRQHRIEHLAADALEVDVDAGGRGLAQTLGQVRIAAVDRRVEAQSLHQVPDLVRAAGDADDARAGPPCQLADHRADRAGRCADHDGLAGPGPADVQQAHLRGEARHARRAQRQRGPADVAQRHQVLAVRQGVVLPAAVRQDQFTGAQVRMARLDHAADGAADQHFAQPDRRRVAGADLLHQVAHVRVERQGQRAQQHLSRAGGRHGHGLEAEVLRHRAPGGAGGEHDAAVDGRGHAGFLQGG